MDRVSATEGTATSSPLELEGLPRRFRKADGLHRIYYDYSN